MDTRDTQTTTRQTAHFTFEDYQSADELALQRLESLLSINAETARQKAMFSSDREQMEAALMENPVSLNKSFSFFGLMLGLFTPAAIFTRFLMETGNFRAEDSWVFGILAVVNLVTAITGYFSGKLISKLVSKTENFSWLPMIFLLSLIGILWGFMSGGAGGAIILLFGAIFGAIFGAMVGFVALPVFAIFHRLLKKGEFIEFKHFLPLSFGITIAISAFILGL